MLEGQLDAIRPRTEHHGVTVEEYMLRLEDSFFFCLCEVYHFAGWDKYDPTDEIVEDMCNWFQFGPKKKETLAPRGDGKTHRIVSAGTVWDLYRDPEWKIGIISKSEKSAKQTLYLVRTLLDKVPFLWHLSPRSGQRDNASELDVAPASESRTPSVWVAGVTSQLPSRRAHRIYGDDIEDKENTKTREAREDLHETTKEFTSIASYGERRIDIIGTYWHEESVYLKLLKNKYAVRAWPILYPKEDDQIIGLAPLIRENLSSGKNKPGDIVRPERYDWEYIEEKQALGRTYFDRQYQLISNTGDENLYPLKLRDLIVFTPPRDVAPITIMWAENNGQGQSTVAQDIISLGFGTDAPRKPALYSSDLVKFRGTKMWIDPSGLGADKTGYSITSFLNGYIYEKETGGDTRGHTPEALQFLAEKAREHRVTDIRIENYGLQSMFLQLFLPILRESFLEPGENEDFPDGWRCSAELCKPKQAGMAKEVRICDVLEPITNSHRLVISEATARNEEFQHQYTRITRQRGALEHEDELESLANCCSLWEVYMSTDPARGEEKRKAEQQKALLAKYAGKKPKRPRWFRNH